MKNDNAKIAVRITTDLGSFLVAVDISHAPITAGNFLAYVDQKLFDGTSFFRIVTAANEPTAEFKISVIQGGMKVTDTHALPAVEHEPTSLSGLRHTNGAISMARPKNGSGSSSFFICIGDQPELDYGGRRYEDHEGFAVFGYVSSGMDIVENIFARAEENPYLIHEIPILGISRA